MKRRRFPAGASLESIRYARRHAFRNVVSGQRVPMELTSLGMAYLAVAPEARRRALLTLFRRRRGDRWPPIAAGIDGAMRSVRDVGYCAASWQPEVVAISVPLQAPPALYSLNLSVLTSDPMDDVVRRLSGSLLKLVAEIQDELARRSN